MTSRDVFCCTVALIASTAVTVWAGTRVVDWVEARRRTRREARIARVAAEKEAAHIEHLESELAEVEPLIDLFPISLEEKS